MVRAALIWADVQHQGEVGLFQESRALGEPLERGLTQDDRRMRRGRNGDLGHQSGRRRFGHEAGQHRRVGRA